MWSRLSRLGHARVRLESSPARPIPCWGRQTDMISSRQRPNLVLGRRHPQLHTWLWWTTACAAGGTLVATAFRLNWAVGALLFGILIGVPQWLVLPRRIRGAGWWILASALAVPMSWIPAIIAALLA